MIKLASPKHFSANNVIYAESAGYNMDSESGIELAVPDHTVLVRKVQHLEYPAAGMPNVWNAQL